MRTPLLHSAALATLLAAASPAAAHPHVWIDMQAAVNFNTAGKLDSIGVSWTFDEFYSQFATDGMDANGNGKFDPAELQGIATTMAQNLKEFRYFTFIEVGGKLATVGAPTGARAVFDKGQLTLSFRLPLATPVDAAATKVRFSSFDPTYYVDIAPVAANAVVFTGQAPKSCSHSLRKVDSTRDNLGSSIGIAMLSPSNDVLNATSAAVIDISCATAARP